MPLMAQITMSSNAITVGATTSYLDPSGAGAYGDGLDVTQTICPTTAGQYVTISFSTFNMEKDYDFFTIYSGPEACPNKLLIQLTGYALPASITSNSPDGCLTLQFTSDGSNVAT